MQLADEAHSSPGELIAFEGRLEAKVREVKALTAWLIEEAMMVV